MTTRELTPEELAELTERLKAGDRAALKEAIAVTKPKRVPKPKAPKPPADPLAHIKDRLSTLSALHAKMMEAKRYWSTLPRERRFMDEKAREFDAAAMKESWEFNLHAHLEPLLQSLRLHFYPPENQ